MSANICTHFVRIITHLPYAVEPTNIGLPWSLIAVLPHSWRKQPSLIILALKVARQGHLGSHLVHHSRPTYATTHITKNVTTRKIQTFSPALSSHWRTLLLPTTHVTASPTSFKVATPSKHTITSES